MLQRDSARLPEQPAGGAGVLARRLGALRAGVYPHLHRGPHALCLHREAFPRTQLRIRPARGDRLCSLQSCIGEWNLKQKK